MNNIWVDSDLIWTPNLHFSNRVQDFGPQKEVTLRSNIGFDGKVWSTERSRFVYPWCKTWPIFRLLIIDHWDFVLHMSRIQQCSHMTLNIQGFKSNHVITQLHLSKSEPIVWTGHLVLIQDRRKWIGLSILKVCKMTYTSQLHPGSGKEQGSTARRIRSGPWTKRNSKTDWWEVRGSPAKSSFWNRWNKIPIEE